MTPRQETLFSSFPPSNFLVSVSYIASGHNKRNKDTIRCAVQVPGHCQEQLKQTLIVRLSKTHFFTPTLDCEKSAEKNIELVTRPVSGQGRQIASWRDPSHTLSCRRRLRVQRSLDLRDQPGGCDGPEGPPAPQPGPEVREAQLEDGPDPEGPPDLHFRERRRVTLLSGHCDGRSRAFREKDVHCNANYRGWDH